MIIGSGHDDPFTKDMNEGAMGSGSNTVEIGEDMSFAYLDFNGLQTSTMNFANFRQITFAFTVTPGQLVQGLVYALMLGFPGGLLPSLRAARLPIVTGLREL